MHTHMLISISHKDDIILLYCVQVLKHKAKEPNKVRHDISETY